MHPIFDRVGIAHVIDVYDISKLADPLYAAFALFQPRGIPREAEVDKRTKLLEIQTFRCRLANIPYPISACWGPLLPAGQR